MARRGIGYFDSRGQYFKTPDEAVVSDLASLLGRIGEGDSLAPGIARILIDKRAEIERIYSDYDEMMLAYGRDEHAAKPTSRVSTIRAV
jgi:hypothetical protein